MCVYRNKHKDIHPHTYIHTHTLRVYETDNVFVSYEYAKIIRPFQWVDFSFYTVLCVFLAWYTDFEGYLIQ